MHRLRAVLATLVVILLSSNALAQTSYTSAASGAWNTATAWSPNGVPGTADSVTIQSGHTISLDSTRTIANATVNGTLNLAASALSVTNTLALAGTVNGGGSLTSNGIFNWTAGTLSGGNTLTVPFGTTLNITGASGKLMESGFHLVIAGTANWTGGTITLNNGSLLDIQPGGIFDAQSDNTITNSYYSGTLSNSGTFRKTAGAGSTTINSGVPFANSGRLTVTSGKLNAQSLTLNAGSILGPGFTLGTGTTTIAAPSVVESGAVVTLSGGTLTGSSSLTVNGTLDWSGGTMSGGASVIVPLGKSMTISGAAQKSMDSGFMLSIAGTAIWTDGKIILNNSSLVDIQPGGVFDAQGDDTVANTYYSGSIGNAGTFRKTAGVAATTVSSGVPFNNSGRIEITAGSTDFQTLTLNAGSVIAGTRFTIVSGNTTIAGASSVEAGALMTLSGGTLQGSSLLTVNGTFQFAGGSMEGGATVTVPAGGVLNFSGASSKTMGSAFDLNIAGIANWTAGTIILNNSATLDVLSGGLLDVKSNDAVTNTYYSGLLRNSGTLRKSAGGGATSVTSGVPFTNSGRMEVLSGTFTAATSTFAAGTVIAGTGFTISTGTTNVTGTSTVETGSSMTLASGGVLSGSVPLTVDGALQWTGGAMSGSPAAADITSAGILNISGAAAKTIESGFHLNISGTAHWAGGPIYVNNSSLLNITAGGLFLVEYDGSISNTYYNGTISNNGIFRKNAGGGAATVSSSVPFANSGRIDITSGTFNANALTLNAGTIISGTGFTISGGATTVSGASSVEAGSAMTMSGGTLTGTSTLTIDGTLDWNGGFMSDAASVTVPAGKTMTISGAAEKTLQTGFTLNIAGAANWTGGSIAINNSSLLNIQSGGVFDAQTDGTIHNTYYNGSIANSGTFRKSAGAGAATISGVPFSNSGRFEILSGTMAATPLTLNAGTVIAGTGFRINSGTTTLAGASSVELGSSMTMAGGTLNGASTLTVNGTLNWIGGNMDSTGTVTIPAGSLLVLSGTGNKVLYSGFNLLNAGTMQWTGGNIHVNNSSLLHNQATGLFLVETDADITNSYYNGTFTNSGILRKTNSTATTAIASGVPFTNTGTIDIRSGALQLSNPSLAGTTILNFGIAGTTPLTGYGRLVVASPVALAGTIGVNVIGPFVPQGGDQYSVITYGSRTGTLAESLSFGSGRSFTTTYNATNLTLNTSGPAITSPLSPNTDTTIGGAAVTINGSGFVSTPTVTFGGTASALVSFVNSGQLTAMAPPHASGTVDVVVTNPDGQPTTAFGAFTYTANGDLSMTMTASPARVATGGVVSYTLSVSNSGPSSSTFVTVSDTLPSGMTLLSVASGGGWACLNDGATPPTVTCTMATLAAGNATPIGINVNAPATSNAALTNTASVTSATLDPIPGNNSGSATIEVITPPSILTVTTAADSGAGSLRQAFDDAGNGLCTSPCTIDFNLSPLAPIQPLTALPALNTTVILDGTTQPGYAATPLIEINGSLCSCTAGISLGGAGSTARALSITGFSTSGLQLTGTGSHHIAASYIGVTTSQTGSANGVGIDVVSPNNTIGGTAAERNVISANAGNGIDIGAGANSTIVENNFIGTDPNGSSPMPNAAGIAIGNAVKAAVTNNTIAFNTADGIYVSGGSGHLISTNTIYGNGESAIDLLSPTEPTVNDAGDGDSGPNNLQNTPVIASAVLVAGNLRVTLNVDSSATPAGSIKVELFDDAGTHLHTACFNGNALSNALVVAPAGTTAAGQSVVATATSFSSACGAPTPTIGDGTSEYSAGAVVAACTPPAAGISSPATTFCTGSSVTLTANASGGSAPYAYQWYSGATPLVGQTAQTLVVTSGGNYSVTVTDAIGCAGTSSPLAIAEATPPVATISAGGPTTFCQGGGVVLTASNGASWLWSPGGATTQSITATASGNYSVTVTGANGCGTTSAPTTVTVQPTPVATITPNGPTTFCQGGSVTLTASNGTSWLWSNGAATQSINVAASGNFSVTVSNGGCSATSPPTTVTVDTPPTASISGPASVCPNVQFVLDAGSGFSSYLWSGGQTTQTITVSQSVNKTYSVTVTNASGCSASASRAVGLTASPDATISAPQSVARNSTGNNAGALAQPGATYAWTIANGTITSGQGTNAIAFTAADGGWVDLQLTVTIGGCSAVRTASVPIEAADMAVVKSAAATVDSGAALVYTIAVANLGPYAASGVTITDYLPPSTTLVSVAAGPWSCTQVGTEVHCSGDAAAGSNSTITITVNAPQQPGAIRNLVKVFSAADPNPANDFSSATTTVIPPVVCTTDAPLLLAPAGGTSATSPVSFAWTAVPHASGYRVSIAVDGAAPQEIGTTGDALSLTAPVPPGAIVAYVDALFAACPSTRSPSIAFTVPSLGPCDGRATALPIAPVNNATLDTSSVELRWNAAPGASGYRVWASIGGTAPAVLGNSETTSLVTHIDSGAVLWWIESLYDGCASTESAHFRFTIPPKTNCDTARPQLLAPNDGASLTGNATVAFTWSSVADAIGYEVYLAAGKGTPVLIGTTNAATTSLTHAVPAGDLEWTVVVNVDRCPSRESQKSRFHFTPPAACVDRQRPILIAPLEDTVTTSPVEFSWSAPAGATRYELYVIRGANAAQLVRATTATAASGIELANGRVKWFVRAYFGEPCSPLDSQQQMLEVVTQPAACAALEAPAISAPGQISSGLPFLVQWAPSLGATHYRLQIAWSSDFTGAESIDTAATSQQLVRTNSGNTPIALFARVRAIDNRCTPVATSSAYGPLFAIFILPGAGTQGTAPMGSGSNVSFGIPLDATFAGQSFTATPNAPWLSVSPSSGVVGATGTTLTATASTAALPLGASLGGVTIALNAPPSGNLQTHATTFKSPTLSVNLVTPVTPALKSTPPPDALIIPAVAHANGINSTFQSDVRVSNTSPLLLQYQLTFTPSGSAGISSSRQTTFSVEPGHTVALDDVLAGWFGTGGDSSIGVLEIRPMTETATSTPGAAFSGLPNLVTFASSRTFNVTPNGTFGQYIPAVAFANFVGRSSDPSKPTLLSLQQIAQSERFRTNLGLVEGSGEPASLLVRVFGDGGQKLAELPVNLAGGEHTQLNAFLAQQGITTLSDGRVEIEVLSAGGKVTAYASVLDNQTSDPLLVSPVTIADSGATRWVLPGVADLDNGFANWQTDMRVFNAGTEPVDATLSFHSQNGGAPRTASITIPAGQVRQFDKTLSTLFDVTNEGGAIHIDTAGAARLVATARTYNQTSAGTYGQFISAVTPSEAAGLETRPLQLLQLEQSSRYRSNVGIAEVTGNAVKLEISVIPADAKVTAVTEVTLAPNEFRQIGSLLESIGLTEAFNARVAIRVIEGNGRVTAYASVIDALTNDPTYVPAQ